MDCDNSKSSLLFNEGASCRSLVTEGVLVVIRCVAVQSQSRTWSFRPCPWRQSCQGVLPANDPCWRIAARRPLWPRKLESIPVDRWIPCDSLYWYHENNWKRPFSPRSTPAAKNKHLPKANSKSAHASKKSLRASTSQLTCDGS